MGAKPLEYNATLVGREDLSDTLSVFRVQPDDVPPDGTAWFEPGQYVAIGLNSENGDGRPVRRPYSIASAPEERRWLEFYVRYVTETDSDEPLTHLLWPRGLGDRLHVTRSFVGHFTLSRTVGEDDPRVRVFVAAGTGLAPFLSIVRSHALRRSPLLSRMAVLHGARHAHELGFREELRAALGRHYMPTVSRPTPSMQEDEAGRVETFFDPGRVERLEERLGLPRAGVSPERAVVYVCGLRGTIAETCRRLIARGFVPQDRRLRRLLEIPNDAPSSLFFEQYDAEPIFPPGEHASLLALRAAADA